MVVKGENWEWDGTHWSVLTDQHPCCQPDHMTSFICVAVVFLVCFLLPKVGRFFQHRQTHSRTKLVPVFWDKWEPQQEAPLVLVISFG